MLVLVSFCGLGGTSASELTMSPRPFREHLLQLCTLANAVIVILLWFTDKASTTTTTTTNRFSLTQQVQKIMHPLQIYRTLNGNVHNARIQFPKNICKKQVDATKKWPGIWF